MGFEIRFQADLVDAQPKGVSRNLKALVEDLVPRPVTPVECLKSVRVVQPAVMTARTVDATPTALLNGLWDGETTKKGYVKEVAFGVVAMQ
jgi:hypothetical protein